MLFAHKETEKNGVNTEQNIMYDVAKQYIEFYAWMQIETFTYFHFHFLLMLISPKIT